MKRRTKVVGVFPNEKSLANLATVVMLRASEDWAFRRYMDMTALWTAEEKPTKIATWLRRHPVAVGGSNGASSLGGYRILNVIEEDSRYLLTSVAGKVGEVETAGLAREAIERAREEARRLGLPTKGLLLRTDRGAAFQSEVFRDHLSKHGIGQVFAPVGMPQGIGKIDQLHRSLKEEKLMREEIRDPLEHERALDKYRHFYNTRRLHQAVCYRTPLEVVEPKRVKVVSFS